MIRQLLPLLLPVLLGACAAVPAPGERLYGQVVEPLTPGRVTASFPALRNALAQGMTPEEVSAGRFATAWCAERDGDGFRETWFPLRLPPHLAGAGGAQVLFHPGVRRTASGPLGDAIGRAPASVAADMVEAATSGPGTTRLGRCDTPERGVLRGELAEPSNASWLRWVQQEDAWLAALPAGALAAGRLVTITCTPGSRETRSFYVEVPEGVSLAPGDLVEAMAGRAVSAGPGPIGRVLRRLPEPPEGAIIEYRPHRHLIGCVPPR